MDGEISEAIACVYRSWYKERQAEPITVEEENKLWEKGVLGESDPQTLLDTVVFLSGIHFAHRSGQEHRSLKLSQFELQTDEDGSLFLLYTENTSKNNQRGLSHRKLAKVQEYQLHAMRTNLTHGVAWFESIRCILSIVQLIVMTSST